MEAQLGSAHTKKDTNIIISTKHTSDSEYELFYAKKAGDYDIPGAPQSAQTLVEEEEFISPFRSG